MEKYLGVKIIKAEPINLGDYNKLRGWKIPENEDPEKEGYLVVYPDGYMSWSPKEVFEEAYRRINYMTFGLAIEAMKKGNKVARVGWNGKGMWIVISDGYKNLNVEQVWNEHNKQIAVANGGTVDIAPYITMKTADNKVQPGWLANQADILYRID